MTDLNIIKIAFYHEVGRSIGVYNLILLKGSIKIISNKNLHLICAESPSSRTGCKFRENYNVRSNFRC